MALTTYSVHRAVLPLQDGLGLFSSFLVLPCPVSSSGPVRPGLVGRSGALSSLGLWPTYCMKEKSRGYPWIWKHLPICLSCRPVVGFCLALFGLLLCCPRLSFNLFVFFDRDYLRGCTVASRAIHALRSHLYCRIPGSIG